MFVAGRRRCRTCTRRTNRILATPIATTATTLPSSLRRSLCSDGTPERLLTEAINAQPFHDYRHREARSVPRASCRSWPLLDWRSSTRPWSKKSSPVAHRSAQTLSQQRADSGARCVHDDGDANQAQGGTDHVPPVRLESMTIMRSAMVTVDNRRCPKRDTSDQSSQPSISATDAEQIVEQSARRGRNGRTWRARSRVREVGS